jgi:hypothetical protein
MRVRGEAPVLPPEPPIRVSSKRSRKFAPGIVVTSTLISD